MAEFQLYLKVFMMEKRCIAGITLIVSIVIVIALLVGGLNSIIPLAETNKTTQPVPLPEDHPNQILGGLSHTMVLDKSLPETVNTVMVYKTVPAHYTRQDILSLAQKFNISPIGRIKEVAEGSSVASEDGKFQAILHNSGFIEYHNSNRDTANPLDVPGNLPSDDEAVKIATTFLKDRDLLPSGAEFRKIDHSRSYHLGNDGNDTLTWEDVEVWYGRTLNGYPVEGTQLMLAIGARGEPIDFFTNWRNYEPYQEFPVKTPDLAFEELKTKGVAVGVMDKPDTVSINKIYLAYHTKAGAETEEYLEPVWVFKGNMVVNGKSATPVEQYIPALNVTPKELVSVLPVTAETTATPTTTLDPLKETTLTTNTTSPITATPSATITVNGTVTSPTPTGTVSITPTASLNVTPSTTTGNSTAS